MGLSTGCARFSEGAKRLTIGEVQLCRRQQSHMRSQGVAVAFRRQASCTAALDFDHFQYPPHARAPSGVFGCSIRSFDLSLPSFGRPRVVPATPNFGNDRNLGLLYNLVGIETLPLNLASACGSAFYGRAAPRRSSIVLRPPRSERTRWSSPRGLPGRPPVPSRARAPCGVCVNSFELV